MIEYNFATFIDPNNTKINYPKKIFVLINEILNKMLKVQLAKYKLIKMQLLRTTFNLKNNKVQQSYNKVQPQKVSIIWNFDR